MLTTAVERPENRFPAATAADLEPAGAPCRDSVSRFSRFKSVRISAAFW